MRTEVIDTAMGKLTFRFHFVLRKDDTFMVEVVDHPDYRAFGHKPTMALTHLYWYADRRFIEWYGEQPRSLEQAEAVARVWARKTAALLVDGTIF
jgi:hypothetical protein